MIERSHLQQFFLIALAALALALCVVIVEPFMGPLVSAGALAILLYPLYAALKRRMPQKRSLAAGLTMLLAIAVIALPAVWIVMTMSKELVYAFGALKSKTAADGGWAEWLILAGSRPLVYFGVDAATADEQVRNFLTDRLEVISGALLRLIQGVVSNVAAFLFKTIVALFVLFYLLRDGNRLLSKAREFLPLQHAVYDRLIAEVGQSVLANVYGVGAVALVQGTMTGLLFYFMGVHSPVLWGVIAGFCSMIPIIGPPIVWGPVALAFAFTGNLGKAAIVAAIGAGVIGTADNIIRPWIVSDRVQLHPLLVFISLLGGAQAFGFLGLFIGPAALSVTLVIFEFLKEGVPGRVPGEKPVASENSLSI